MRTIGIALLAITSIFTALVIGLKAAQRAVEEALKSGQFDLSQALSDVFTSGSCAYLLVLAVLWLVIVFSSSKHQGEWR